MKSAMIKASTTFFVICILTTSMVAAVPTLENIQVISKDVLLQLNDEPLLSASAIVHKDRIYLPIRFIVEQLHAQIHWDELSNTISIQSPYVFRDFPEANPLEKEKFIYGEILAIDKKSNLITIEEHYDDRDTYIEPNLQVKENVIIILQRNDKQMNLSFGDLRIGDHIGLVLNKDQEVRGIILNQ
ncbi:hypothetical protein HNQ80_001888 [Anaerosolibacter carboniphilus]|uniref:Copper amine oxidase-like N-terminal domain-containing protein n=1 Tax=Anaerosolibacter carboniphilus TaxID=1417629 RepID=A0A841KQU8_9FIRM|nr:stalk domain-containing protein [Anaerosolibacter carboniphilus]MBB6215797.1 hypothetical protein [Anaerosolibacter carboniphilus]